MKTSEITDFQIKNPVKKIHILLPHFNENYGQKLLENCIKELNKLGCTNITTSRVFGALELPFAAKKISETQKPDVIIALGIVIRGGTTHYELVTETTHNALMNLQLQINTPIIFGLLTCENEEQVKERLNKGRDFAIAALLQTNF